MGVDLSTSKLSVGDAREKTACSAVVHGTASAYNTHGCRCPEARKARYIENTLRQMERAKGVYRKQDATGTKRRLQALVALGWSFMEMGRRLGISDNAVHAYLTRQVLHVNTIAAVRRLYDELSMTPGPCKQARSMAVKRGWVPPLAWDDETIDDPSAVPQGTLAGCGLDWVAVERRIAGDAKVPLTHPERRRAVALLVEAGLNDQEISRRTGIGDRQVLRDRRRSQGAA